MPILFLLIFLLSVLGMIISMLVEKRLKSNHLQIWNSFGFPNNSAHLPDARNEGRHAKASLRAHLFIFSKRRKDLRDSYLNFLAALFTTFSIFTALLLCISAVLVFKDLQLLA